MNGGASPSTCTTRRGSSQSRASPSSFPDMYGDAKTADNPKDAGALSSSVMKNPTVMESRFKAARDQLAKQPRSIPRKSAPSATASAARWWSMARAQGLCRHRAFRLPGLDAAPHRKRQRGEVLVLNDADDPLRQAPGQMPIPVRRISTREGQESRPSSMPARARVYEPGSHRTRQEVQSAAQIRRQGKRRSGGRGCQVLCCRPRTTACPARRRRTPPRTAGDSGSCSCRISCLEPAMTRCEPARRCIGELLDRRSRHHGVVGGRQHQDRLADVQG